MAKVDQSFTELSQTSQNAILEYCKKMAEFTTSTWDHRQGMMQIDKEYYRENLNTPNAAADRIELEAGNKGIIRDMVVPIVEPQTETSLAFLTSIFCTGQPMFGIVSPPEHMSEAQAVEALIDSHATYGSWIRQWTMAFRHGYKYNLFGMEIDWCEEKTYSPYTTLKQTGAGVEPRDTVWRGNKIRAIDPYNLMFDPRVTPAEMHSKGEFVGYVELMSRIQLKEYLAALPSRMNQKEAFEAGIGTQYRFFIPQINWTSLVQRNLSLGFDWMSWALQDQNNPIRYRSTYEVLTRYCKIIPNDFRISVPARNTSQIWKFVTVNDQVLVSAQKMTNAHNWLPILMGQLIEDGLSYQTKSPAQRLVSLQDSASAMWNARMAARRRSISDRALFNPAMVREEDVNNPNPAAKIPVRSMGYNKKLEDAYHQIPYEDRDSGSFVSDAREMMNLANYVSGQNPAQQGQFVKGNKTQTEFQDIMGNSSGRQIMMAWCVESQTMVPFKHIMMTNILQYQTAQDIFSSRFERNVSIDPIKIRQAILQFKIADGLIPKDKLISEETIQVGFQTIAAVPALQQRYDVVGVFSYLMAVKGMDLKPFEIQQPQQQTLPGQGVPGAQPGASPSVGIPAQPVSTASPT